MSLGDNLKKLRINKGLSMEDLARELDTAHPQISRWEKNQRVPTLDWVYKLAKVLECTPAEILGYEFLGLDSNTLRTPLVEPSEVEPNNQTLTSLNTNKEYELQEYEALHTQEVPIFTQDFACGIGSEVLSHERSKPNYIDKAILRELTPNLTKVIGVKASGDSMYPIIKSGSIVLVDTAIKTLRNIKQSKDPLKNTFAFRYDGTLLIKMLDYNKETNIVFASSYNKEDPDYKAFKVDLNEQTDFQLIGKVIASFNKF